MGRSEGCDATRDAQAGGDGREDGDGRLDDKLQVSFLFADMIGDVFLNR